MFKQADIAPEWPNSKTIAGIVLIVPLVLGLIHKYGVIGIVVPLLAFFLSKDRFVKFHAAQFLLLLLMSFPIGIIMLIIMFGGIAIKVKELSMLSPLLGMAWLIVAGLLWLYQIYSAFTGRAPMYPLIGKRAAEVA
ncbi:MAG: hypothetical protein QXG98_01610 [Candidatus Micrarchaeia archaeon]